MAQYDRSGHANVVTPWATESDLENGFDGVAPVQAHTCQSYGDQTFIRGSRETVDAAGLLSELQRHVSLEHLMGAFRRIDSDGKGSVTSAQYRRICDNLAPHLPKTISSQIMLLGADEVGIIWYGPLFRTLGLTESDFPPQMQSQPRAVASRAKGTSGDIIAHRDDNMFESMDPIRRERITAVAATTSGDIIGHLSPIRSADLAWDVKGRVGTRGCGSVLAYAHPAINPVRENPEAYSAYKCAGDIIGNTDAPNPNTRRPEFVTRLRKYHAEDPLRKH
jgi:hypothetical protein